MIREKPNVICRVWVHARVHLFNLSDLGGIFPLVILSEEWEQWESGKKQ